MDGDGIVVEWSSRRSVHCMAAAEKYCSVSEGRFHTVLVVKKGMGDVGQLQK